MELALLDQESCWTGTAGPFPVFLPAALADLQSAARRIFCSAAGTFLTARSDLDLEGLEWAELGAEGFLKMLRIIKEPLEFGVNCPYVSTDHLSFQYYTPTQTTDHLSDTYSVS